MKFSKQNVTKFLKSKGYEVESIEGGYIGEDELHNNTYAYTNLAKYRDGLTKGRDGNYYNDDDKKMVYAYCIYLTNGEKLFDCWQYMENWQDAMIDQIKENEV